MLVGKPQRLAAEPRCIPASGKSQPGKTPGGLFSIGMRWAEMLQVPRAPTSRPAQHLHPHPPGIAPTGLTLLGHAGREADFSGSLPIFYHLDHEYKFPTFAKIRWQIPTRLH